MTNGILSSIEIVPFDLEKFPNIVRWYKNAPKDTPGWNEKVDSLKQAKKFLEEKLAKKKESEYSMWINGCIRVIRSIMLKVTLSRADLGLRNSFFFSGCYIFLIMFDNYSKHLIVANQSNTVPDKNESILSVQGLESNGNVKSYSTNNFLPID